MRQAFVFYGNSNRITYRCWVVIAIPNKHLFCETKHGALVLISCPMGVYAHAENSLCSGHEC
jgi:hypothetical protein